METNTIKAEDIELASVTERKEIREANFNSHCEKIKNAINGIAEYWFQIAYYVYEMDHFHYYLNHYDNIVDCCKAEFGFKKSTTYNFIKIVKDSACSYYVRYQDFIASVKGWSYSQLVSMLSLSDKEREKATPDMSVREIKRLKTDSKRLENNSAESSETAPAEIVVPADPISSQPSPAVPVPGNDGYFDYTVSVLNAEISDYRKKFESERASNHQINCKLVDMTAERDKALQDIDEFKQQVKKLRSENRKLKAEIKALKFSSEPGSDC